jgi:phytoene synthase
MNPELAYERCAEITRERARNFFYGIRLLPPDKRNAMSAVYAFARRIDDIGDGEELPAEERITGLELARKELHHLEEHARAGADPVLTALADAAQRYSLPLEAFDELIDGCLSDVRGTAFGTFDELHVYCRQVAGSVGRLSLAVFGSRFPDRDRRHADDLGVALQLTNILRDVVEDRRNGRIYLPAEDLDRFGCTLQLGEGDAPIDDEERLFRLFEYQAARAEEWYERGLRLLNSLDPRSRACCAAMAGIYHRLLRRMALRPVSVLRGRTSLPGWEKALVAGRALAGASQ